MQTTAGRVHSFHHGHSIAHIIAMTGSYFRGDSVPVCCQTTSGKFTKVTYNYYEQLNGYCHLKSLGHRLSLLPGKYTIAIMEVLDTDRRPSCTFPL